jgi:transcriptional regulator with PAS, ATPase and Fis domain
MVQDNKFREDLFYRLKMGYIKIPPLRKRKKDLNDLIEYFTKQETDDDIVFSPEVIEILYRYEWFGNVRELKNTIMYIMAVKEGDYITLKYIPDKGFFEYSTENIITESEKKEFEIDSELKSILKIIYDLNESGKIAGREIIEKESIGTEHELTRYQIRNRLDRLENLGLIIKKRGKHGTILSNKGKGYLNYK